MSNQNKRLWNTETILEETLRHVAPLPSQLGYARALASIFSMHIYRNLLIDDGTPPDELPTPSAVVVAPTGQGKTFLIRKMADVLDLHVITIDCSTLAAEGWKGNSLSQRLASVYLDEKDKSAFARSVLFFDEVDKLKLWGTNADQGNAMTNILQMFNSGSVFVNLKETSSIDVSRFLVLFGGAFVGLDKIIQERVCPKAPIGFGSNVGEKKAPAEQMQETTLGDLAKFGMMPELLGRIGTVLTIPPLGVEDYRQLLSADTGSARMKFRNYLMGAFGVEFLISEEGTETIAQKCIGAETGARAINPLVDAHMREAIATVESNNSICRVILDAREGICFLTYEHGPRAYAYRDPSRAIAKETLPWHTVKANNPQAMVRKLCRYYRNANGRAETLDQLEAFLHCAVVYLYRRNRLEDFCFDSLEAFARATSREEAPNGRPGRSELEKAMMDPEAHVPGELRSRFASVYSDKLQGNLVAAQQTIMAYLQERHGPCCVRFRIPKGK